MSDEQAFLDAIDDRPGDRDIRLVYADWLEEHGDPRADLIRAEEEMRRVPIASDRFWELKPRRNALRERCATDWLARMRYGTDYEPVLGTVPDDWKGRWRLLREFVERWHGVPMGDVGRHADVIAATEAELGLALPPSFREWIAFASDLMDRKKFDRVLRDCYEVRDLDDLSAVSLMIQGEADYYWAVKKEHLTLPDPPVHGYSLDYEGDADRFIEQGPFAPHVTSFVFRHMLSYCHGKGGGFGARVDADYGPLIRRLTEAFPVQSRFEGLRVFEAENVLVSFGPSPYAEDDQPELQVKVWKPEAGLHAPAFLRDIVSGGGWFHSIFNPHRP
jgi:uncharacterized protein (TIGR02996 family)